MATRQILSICFQLKTLCPSVSGSLVPQMIHTQTLIGFDLFSCRQIEWMSALKKGPLATMLGFYIGCCDTHLSLYGNTNLDSHPNNWENVEWWSSTIYKVYVIVLWSLLWARITTLAPVRVLLKTQVHVFCIGQIPVHEGQAAFCIHYASHIRTGTIRTGRTTSLIH